MKVEGVVCGLRWWGVFEACRCSWLSVRRVSCLQNHTVLGHPDVKLPNAPYLPPYLPPPDGPPALQPSHRCFPPVQKPQATYPPSHLACIILPEAILGPNHTKMLG